MEIRTGNKRIFQNVKVGVAQNPDFQDELMLIFTDQDNETDYMFEMPTDKLEDYFQMIRDAVGKKSVIIAGANEMPRGPHGLA
jgi:hypothetical protein